MPRPALLDRPGLLVLLPLLTACDPGLGGDWAGDLSCVDEDFEGTMGLALALNRVDEHEYVGTGSQTYTGQVETGGAWRDLEGSLSLVELEAAVDGDQVDVQATTEDCEMTLDGQPVDMQCGTDFELTATWDGGDALLVDDGDCAGELTR